MADDSQNRTIGVKFYLARKTYGFYNVMNYPFKVGDNAVVRNSDGYMEQVKVVSVGKLKKTPTKPVFPFDNHVIKPIGATKTGLPKI